MIYVFCPYGLVTGGPDALHQLVYYLNKIDKKASIVYCDIEGRNHNIPRNYLPYVSSYLLPNEVIDDCKSIIVLPETLSFLANRFNKSRIYIWWLSWDNNETDGPGKRGLSKVLQLRTWKLLFKGYYSPKKIKNYLQNKPYVFTNERQNVYHLCASYYTFNFVSKKSSRPISLLIEPISKFFLEKGQYLSSNKERENIVLYNPKKNFLFTKKILKRARNTNLLFAPLIGKTQDELLEIYRKAKIYMDFGTFPGAERIPKEAVFNGCLIITGRNGAADNNKDVPIPSEFKIPSKEENIDRIIDKLIYMEENFDVLTPLFKEYRDRVGSLEDDFVKSLFSLFDIKH